MPATFSDHTEVSERCSIYRSLRWGDDPVWFATCHVCDDEEPFFGDTANAAAIAWGEDHECPIAVQVDES